MASSSTPDIPVSPPVAPPDGVSLRRWFAFFALWLAVGVVAVVWLVQQSGWSWAQWRAEPARTFTETGTALKLVGFTLYLSLCCTFLPLPTGWIVAAVATREAAVTGELFSTVAVVALTGAIGSTLANLNEYHLFTALLRHHRVAALRHTRTYRAAARWFGRRPFATLVIFNVIPIPIDVIRMLAITYRYSRPAFAAANFIGRFPRYAVIAFATYYWNLGWIAPVALLGLAVILVLGRIPADVVRKSRRRARVAARAAARGKLPPDLGR